MNVCTDEDLAFLSIPIFFLVASSKVLSARSSAGRGTVRSLEGRRNLALLDLCLHVCVLEIQLRNRCLLLCTSSPDLWTSALGKEAGGVHGLS